jgi:hypothetical protein
MNTFKFIAKLHLTYVKEATEWLIPIQLFGERTSEQKGVLSSSAESNYIE